MRTTAIMNLKGGTAKTVTAINTAVILSKLYGRRVLLIDADSQGNLSEFTAKKPEALNSIPGTAALLQGKPYQFIETKLPDVHLIPGGPELMDLDISSARYGSVNPMALVDVLYSMTGDGSRADFFDHVLIDCPPAFSAAAMAALAAADDVIIPVKLDAFGIRGLTKLIAQIDGMKKINPDLEIAGVLPTMYYSTPTQRLAEEDLQTALEKVGIRKFRHVRRSPSVDGSTFAQSPLVYYSPKSGACRDYKIFVRELIGEEAEDYGV